MTRLICLSVVQLLAIISLSSGAGMGSFVTNFILFHPRRFLMEKRNGFAI